MHILPNSTYRTDLEYQLEGVKLDENYRKLQANVAKNVTKNLSTRLHSKWKGVNTL